MSSIPGAPAPSSLRARLARAQPGILFATRAALAVGLVASALEASWLIAFVAGLSLALTFLPVLLRRWRVVDLPLSFEVAGALFVLASLFLGEAHGWYTKFWWWDLFLHGTSAIVIGTAGYLLLSILLQASKSRTSPRLVAIFTFSFALAIGTLWEVLEFGIDLSLGTNMQKSGLIDTMTDLTVDAVGALLAAIAAGLHAQGKKGWLEHLWHVFREKNHWMFRPDHGEAWPPARHRAH